jgi:UPF0271 protein
MVMADGLSGERPGVASEPTDYRDLSGFGRRDLAASPAEIAADVIYQIGALDAFCRAAGSRVRYAKLHGAMYHRAAKDREVAKAVAFALRQLDSELVVLGPEGSALLQAAAETGLDVAREAFVDRAYLPDGQLLLGTSGAMLTMLKRWRASADGEDRPWCDDGTRCVSSDSICVRRRSQGGGDRARRAAPRDERHHLPVRDDPPAPAVHRLGEGLDGGAGRAGDRVPGAPLSWRPTSQAGSPWKNRAATRRSVAPIRCRSGSDPDRLVRRSAPGQTHRLVT